MKRKKRRTRSIFSPEDDRILIAEVEREDNESGESSSTTPKKKKKTSWSVIAAKVFNNRFTPGQLYQRYHRVLKVSKKEWSAEEDEKLIKLYKQLGAKWSEICRRLDSGKCDVWCRNRYHKLVKSKRQPCEEYEDDDEEDETYKDDEEFKPQKKKKKKNEKRRRKRPRDEMSSLQGQHNPQKKRKFHNEEHHTIRQQQLQQPRAHQVKIRPLKSILPLNRNIRDPHFPQIHNPQDLRNQYSQKDQQQQQQQHLPPQEDEEIYNKISNENEGIPLPLESIKFDKSIPEGQPRMRISEPRMNVFTKSSYENGDKYSFPKLRNPELNNGTGYPIGLRSSINDHPPEKFTKRISFPSILPNDIEDTNNTSQRTSLRAPIRQVLAPPRQQQQAQNVQGVQVQQIRPTTHYMQEGQYINENHEEGFSEEIMDKMSSYDIDMSVNGIVERPNDVVRRVITNYGDTVNTNNTNNNVIVNENGTTTNPYDIRIESVDQIESEMQDRM